MKVPGVYLSICLSHHLHVTAAGLLLSAVSAGDIDRQWPPLGPAAVAPQHDAQQQITLSSKCKQSHVYSCHPRNRQHS